MLLDGWSVVRLLEEERFARSANAHLIDDETVAKMGRPDLLWVRPGPPAHEWGIQIGKIHGWATRPKSFLGLCVLSELRQNCLCDEGEDRC